MSFLLSLVFFFHKMEEQEGGTDSALKLGRTRVAQTMYIHM
jgi:hypothetical protein